MTLKQQSSILGNTTLFSNFLIAVWRLTLVRCDAFTLISSDVIGLEATVDWVILPRSHLWKKQTSFYLVLSESLVVRSFHIKNHVTYHLLNGIRDEYEGDEAGETLLCEAGHVLDNVAGVWDYQQETLQTRVKADPQTQLHVVYIVTPVKREVLSSPLFWLFEPNTSVCFCLCVSYLLNS